VISVPIANGLLASWDVSALPRLADIRIELRVWDANGQMAIDASHPHIKLNEFEESPGWPVTIGDPADIPALADFDGNAGQEIFVEDTNLAVFQANGEPLPGWTLPTGGAMLGPPTIADIVPGGGQELVYAPPGQAQVAVYSSDGAIVGGWPRTVTGVVYRRPVVGDLDHDGDAQVIVFGGSLGSFLVYVFEPNGESSPGWPRSVPQPYSSAPVLADVDADGKLEVVVPMSTKTLLLAPNGETLPGWPVSNFYSPCDLAAGDIEGDGADEIIAGKVDSVFVWNGAGMTKPGWPRKLGFGVERIALGDLTGDGILEVVIDALASRVFALAADGTTMAGWPLIDATGFGLSAIADVDADSKEEILLVSENEVRAYDEDGSVSPEWPMVFANTVCAAVLGDVDGDEAFDLIVQAGGFDVPIEMHRFEMEKPVAGGWRQLNADATNARRYRRSASSTSTVTTMAPATVLHLDVPRPNPSTSGVLFRWSQPEDARATLQVFGVDGRLIETLADRIVARGVHMIAWDGRTRGGGRIPSGVYYVRLTSRSLSSNQKWVLIRP
jgi:hypothetical protein